MKRASKKTLSDVLKHPAIWRGGVPKPAQNYCSSGISELDAMLPGHGWPHGALIELLLNDHGIGELSLLLPTLAQITQTRRAWVTLVTPPFVPYAPHLQAAGIDLDRLIWISAESKPGPEHCAVAESALRMPDFGAVVLWGLKGDTKTLRRLQLAAEAGNNFAFIFRPLAQKDQPSPARLRLGLSTDGHELCIELLKSAGSWQRQNCRIRRKIC